MEKYPFNVFYYTLHVELKILLIEINTVNRVLGYTGNFPMLIVEAIIAWYCINSGQTKSCVALTVAASFRMTEPSKTRLSGQL